MQHKVAFHQGLDYLLRYEKSLGAEIHLLLKFLLPGKKKIKKNEKFHTYFKY